MPSLSVTQLSQALRQWLTLPPRAALLRNPLMWAGSLSLLAFFGYELFTARAPSASSAITDPLANGNLLVSVVANLGLIVLLIYGSLYLLRRWQGGALARGAKRIAVLETTRLSPKQALHLVRVGEQTWLIGASDAGLTLLSEVELRAPAEFATALAQVAERAAVPEVHS
jgi:flagellar biosynthetic protein FliO